MDVSRVAARAGEIAAACTLSVAPLHEDLFRCLSRKAGGQPTFSKVQKTVCLSCSSLQELKADRKTVPGCLGLWVWPSALASGWMGVRKANTTLPLKLPCGSLLTC